MRARPRDLCSGPGKLCQALAIPLDQTRIELAEPRFELTAREPALEPRDRRRPAHRDHQGRPSSRGATAWPGSQYLSRPAG